MVVVPTRVRTGGRLPVRCAVAGVPRVRIGRHTVSGMQIRRPLRIEVMGTVVVQGVLSAHGVVGRAPGAHRLRADEQRR